MKKSNIKRPLKPSQRESITEFTSGFGNESSYSSRILARKIIRIILIAVSVLLIVFCGYFFTELLISISELPAVIRIIPEDSLKWILFPSIQG